MTKDIRHDLIMNSINDKRDLVGLAELNTCEKVVTLVNTAYFRIDLVCFWSLFIELSTSDEIDEIIWAFREVKASDTAECVKQAQQLVDEDGDFVGQDVDYERLKVVDYFPGDDDFLYTYIKQHLNELVPQRP